MERPVNAFQIKRQAHAVSRSDAGFNPFGHIWNNKDRRQTWDGEAQRGLNIEDDVEAGSPIEHSQTAPTGAYGAFGHSTQGRTSKDGETDLAGPDRERNGERERPDSSGDTVVASQAPGSDFTAVDTGAQMRNRTRLEKEPVDSPGNEPADEPKKKKEHRMFKNVQPKEPFTVGNQIQRTLLSSWINILLIAAPVGIILGALPNMNPIAIFVVNFIAIIPLAALLGFATEEIALRTGETLGGLLNASFGYVLQFAAAVYEY